MNLRSLRFPTILDSSSGDINRDFLEPALSVSVRYDRGVGFFSAAWLRLAVSGMVAFAENHGYARWVTSPILSEDDWEALQLGYEARDNEVLFASLMRQIAELPKALSSETLSALAWLVADGIIDFKLALPRNKLDRGDFHDKFGIFTDSDGDLVSFSGSYNDSVQGARNYESIKIFPSWDPSFAEIVAVEAERFEALWGNRDPNVRVFDIPEAAKARIVELRTHERPFRQSLHPGHGAGATRETEEGIRRPAPPASLHLRDYQEAAISAWFDAGCRGLLEMATGTGKTITALSAALRLFEREGRLIILVACPFKHLVAQWAKEATAFGLDAVRVAESSQKWEPELARQLRSFKKRHRNLVTVVTTNAAFHQAKLRGLFGKLFEQTLLIADEAHNMGSVRILRSLPDGAPWRLGLSATPERQFDEAGTRRFLEYFGGVIFRFGLDEAIGTCLTPYYYHPIPVPLLPDEFQEWCYLTRRIKALSHGGDHDGFSEQVKRLAIRRARVVNNSLAKLAWVQENIAQFAPIEYTLFYAGDRLLAPLTQFLGTQLRLRVHEFTNRQTNAQRSDLLARFGRKDLQALVAIRCLDEGVDVPPTRTAFFLASSGNPREFTQRRGRVLRLWPGKEHATLYDLVSVPPDEYLTAARSDPEWPAVRAAIRREYSRVKAFASLAENKHGALDALFDLANRFDVLDA